MTVEEAIQRMQKSKIVKEALGYKDAAVVCDMAIAALRAQQEREHPKPLTLDELREMDGEPVYLSDLVEKGGLWEGWIVFTSHNEHGFIPRGGGWFSITGYGKTWLAYRHKPEEE